MNKVLSKSFFNRRTDIVAKELLGKVLVRRLGDQLYSYVITEVEAYIGPHDLASHSSKGRTPRTETMYQEAGTLYIYLIYGMYYMLNIVTDRKDYPAAVLIRGVESISGPGRVARALTINKTINSLPLSKKTGIWVEDRGVQVAAKDIIRTPRIGVAYAGDLWANKKLRFVLHSTNKKLH
jgi:DNA-3-methyladenine glycosylase